MKRAATPSRRSAPLLALSVIALPSRRWAPSADSASGLLSGELLGESDLLALLLLWPLLPCVAE